MRPSSLALLLAALLGLAAVSGAACAEGALSGIGQPSGGLSAGPAAPLGPPSGARIRVRLRAEKALRLGIVAAVRPEQAIDRIDPFRRRLADTLAGEVAVATFPDERRLIDALAAGRIDYARLSATGYATAWVLCGCVEPLAAPRAGDGTAGYHAAIVTRTGSPLKKLADLAGHTLAISSGNALATRRLPLLMMAREGLTGERAPALQEVDGPASALRAVLAGRADAAVVWSTLEGDQSEGWGRGTLHDFVAKGDVSMADVRVIWSSPVLPHGPQVVRAGLDEGRKRRLRDMLIDLDEVDPDAYEAIEPTHAGGFLRIVHAAYATWLKLVTPDAAPAVDPGTTGTAAPPG
jgi:phosphonate transport system substrate-binding protein